jgi:hypothetical protein
MIIIVDCSVVDLAKFVFQLLKCCRMADTDELHSRKNVNVVFVFLWICLLFLTSAELK